MKIQSRPNLCGTVSTVCIVCLASALVWGAGDAQAHAQGSSNTLLDVVIGDPEINYGDPEFWDAAQQLCWQDLDTNDVWICSFDPQSGALIPADGRGVSCGAATNILLNGEATDPRQKWGSFNGPEWGVNGQGRFVYFTVRDENQVMQTARFGPVDEPLPQLVQLSQGGVIGRGGALPTTNPALPIGAVGTFLIPDHPQLPEHVVWRFDNEPNVDRLVPLADIGLKGPRWIPGELALVTNTADIFGTVQAAWYDLTDESLRIITNDFWDKTDSFVFYSPERNRRVLVCRVGTREIGFYEEAEPHWKPIGKVHAPWFFPGGGILSTIQFAEPFVFDGKSYVVFTVGTDLEFLLRLQALAPRSPAPASRFPLARALPPVALAESLDLEAIFLAILEALLPSRIYVASLEGLQPKLACDENVTYRLDPEVVTSGDEPLLYYYSFPNGITETSQLHVVRNFLP